MNFEEDIKKCVETISAGGTILYPTDTVWGLGCDALNENAIDKIFDIKNRPREKSLIVLLADARSVIQYVAAPHPDIIDILENFDRPTTVIYDGALSFPLNAVHADGSIAIRVTRDPFCKALIKRLQTPVVSTSANLSGEPTPATFDAIQDEIKQRVDYVVKYRQDDMTIKPPSRLVRIKDDGSLEIIRP
ncbi:MAG: threonylcarbamoyl-AMP synthase [Sphingobacteriales bacterium]|nr:MAG: threonylcarbamoyl-AMP synthase [Sphingobacteriales bacterium]